MGYFCIPSIHLSLCLVPSRYWKWWIDELMDGWIRILESLWLTTSQTYQEKKTASITTDFSISIWTSLKNWNWEAPPSMGTFVVIKWTNRSIDFGCMEYYCLATMCFRKLSSLFKFLDKCLDYVNQILSWNMNFILGKKMKQKRFSQQCHERALWSSEFLCLSYD